MACRALYKQNNELGSSLGRRWLDYRIYCKGAQEVLLTRCTKYAGASGKAQEFTNEAADEFDNISQQYARRGMRCLALAYGGDLPAGTDLEKLPATQQVTQMVLSPRWET